MRKHPKHTVNDPQHPRAWGTSDGNGFIGHLKDLRWQFDWAGANIINKRILLHEDELDKPQRQLGILILPPDPMPVMWARPEPYDIDETP